MASKFGLTGGVLERRVRPMRDAIDSRWFKNALKQCATLLSKFPNSPYALKKKGGVAEQTNSRRSQEIRDSIRSLCETIKNVTEWLSDQINKPDDAKFETIISLLQINKGSQGPGKILHMFEDLVLSLNNIDLGDRISQALQAWNAADIARKVIGGQTIELPQFLRICESKVKSLQAFRMQS